MATVLQAPRSFAAVEPVQAPPAGLWHAYTVAFAAACVMIGVYWDISWHMSIGRDSFWTPAHLLIQAGGLIAGISSGYVALKTTFRGTRAERDAAVGFWGFRAPLGAWICIWGCGAMLTSAPFDNWWHNAYGLDVKIVSPPHTVLALGIYSIVVGALLLTLAQQNRAEGDQRRRLALVLAMIAMVYPFALAAIARAVKLKWPATIAAATYMAVTLSLMWFLQLFPATPKLGPIYQHVTHMMTLTFPLLLIVPGFAIDLVFHEFAPRARTMTLAALLGAAFMIAFVAVEWPFATFLVENPASRNWFFNGDTHVYWAPPSYMASTHRFPPHAPGMSWLLAAFGVAYVYAVLSSALGLAWGRWMARVQR